jgi:hypothetical protein
VTTAAAYSESVSAQVDYIRSVCVFADQFSPGHPGHGLVEAFLWTYEPRFGLSALAGSRSEWVEFALRTSRAWREDYGENNEADFENWWLPEPVRSLVIFVEGTDGHFYVWDGNHRVGVAMLNNKRTLPAIVGFRKPSCEKT